VFSSAPRTPKTSAVEAPSSAMRGKRGAE
jgi:hypothetical protein